MKITELVTPSITSTTVADTTEPAWSAGSTYATGDTVSAVGADGLTYEYESLQDSNTAHAVTDPAWWLKLGATNRHAMFDFKSGSKTTSDASIVVTVAAGARFDRIGLLGVSGCSEIRVVVVVGADTLHDQTLSMTDTLRGISSTSWSEYFFGEKGALLDLRIFDVITPSTLASVTVTITKSTAASTVSCAALVIGRSANYGETLDGANISRESFSTIEDDGLGNTDLVARRSARRAEITAVFDSNLRDAIHTRLGAIDGKVALFDLNSSYSSDASLVLLGFYEDYDIVMLFNKSRLNLVAREIL